MGEPLRALDGARAVLVRALKYGRGSRVDAEAVGHELVDDIVSALLLGHVGALAPAAVNDVKSGMRTLDGLRAVAQAWWVWRDAGPPYGLQVPAEVLREVALAADAWVRAFDGTPADVLLAYHEARLSLDRDARKDKGAFYTPSPVADELVASALSLVTRRPGKPPRILDPACGTGVFLVAAFRRLASAQIDQPMEGSLARRLALAGATLHGVDLDARAVDLARRAVILTVLDDPRVQEELALALAFPSTLAIARAVGGILHGDSLLGEDASLALHGDAVPLVKWSQSFSSAFATGGFDLVIGNPPFASFGGREGHALDPDLKAYLEAHHGTFRWPSLHGWFVAAAVRLWARDTVAFVLPEQVFHLEGYADLRRLVGEHFVVREAKTLDADTFGEAVAPSATVTLKRSDDARPESERARPWLVPSRPFGLEHLIARGSSLRGWFVDCGIRTTDRGSQVRRIGAASAEDSGNWVPVLEGKDIGLWRTSPPRVEVRLGEGVYSGAEKRYDSFAYVIRQTAAYPICAKKSGARYFRNSLLGVTTPDGASCDVRFVVAFLNARLGRYLYAVLVQESAQRVFPQVKLGALAKLPIRFPEGVEERALHDRIVVLADARFGSVSGSNEALAIEADIDVLMEQLHEIDDELREEMASRLRVLPPPP